MMLRVSGISRTFGGLLALSEVDLSVGGNEIVSVIGPNGAGKTTLFNVICGAVPPTSGAVRFEGRDITGLPPYVVAGLGVGRTFQHSRHFTRLTVAEHLRVPKRAQGIVGDTGAILQLCQLETKRDRFPAEITYEEQRKLEIARVLSGNPKLILLDEPAAGLNTQEAERLMQLIRRVRDRGCSVMVIEHNMGFVMEISDRVVVLNFGSKIAEGAPGVIQDDATVHEAYMGSEA